MMTQAYSFHAQSDVTLMTEAQLHDLLAERRARGTSEDVLMQFEAWHHAALQDQI